MSRARRWGAPPLLPPRLLLLAAVAALLLGVLVPQGTSRLPLVADPPRAPHTGAGTGAAALGTSGRTAPGASSPEPRSSPRPTRPVSTTLVLANNSLLPGNYVPSGGVSAETAVSDPQDGLVYVVCYWSNDLEALSGRTHEVKFQVTGLVLPQWITYDPGDDDIYVVSNWNSTDLLLSQIAAATGEITDEGYVPTSIGVLVADPVHEVVYVDAWTESSGYMLWGLSVPSLDHVRTISLSAYPTALVMGPLDQDLFVASGSTITEFNASTDESVRSVGLSATLEYMAFDPVDGYLDLLGTSGTDLWYLELLSATTLEVVVEQGVTYLPFALSVDPTSGNIFVPVNNGSTDLSTAIGRGNVSVFAPFTAALLATVPVGVDPWGCAAGLEGEVAVADERSDQVTFVNSTTFAVEATTPLAMAPAAVLAIPSAGRLYVANDGTDNVSVVSLASGRVVGSVDVGLYPRALAFDPSTLDLFVANTGSSNVSVISTTLDTLVATVSVAPIPCSLAYDPVDGVVWVSEGGAGEVSAINATTLSLVQNISVGGEPNAMVFDATRDTLDVLSQSSSTLTIASGSDHTSLLTVPVDGAYPSAIALDPSQEELFISNYDSDDATVLSSVNGTYLGELVPGTNQSDDLPESILYDASENQVFVGSAEGNSVLVFSATSLRPITNFSVGYHPEGLTADGSSVYVANYGSGTISAVPEIATANVTVLITPMNQECSEFEIDGQMAWNGSTVPLTLGEHTLEALPDCPGERPFVQWVSYGGVPVSDLLDYDTQMNVTGTGTLEALYGDDVEQVELTFSIDPSECGPIVVDGEVEYNGDKAPESAGSDSLEADACTGYEFTQWNFTGSVSVAQPGSGDTVLDLGGAVLNGTLTAWYRPTNPGELEIAVSADPTSGVAPLEVTLAASVSGGSPPYTVDWTFGDDGSGEGEEVVHVYDDSGEFAAEATAYDSEGRTVSSVIDITVTSTISIDVEVSPTPSTITLGETSLIYFEASGGDPPLTLDWVSVPPGCPTSQIYSGETIDGELPCTPSQAGTFTLQAQVEDTEGHVGVGRALLVVQSPTTTTTTPPTTTNEVWVPMVLLAVLALAVATWVVLLWRGRLPPNGELPPAPSTASTWGSG